MKFGSIALAIGVLAAGPSLAAVSLSAAPATQTATRSTSTPPVSSTMKGVVKSFDARNLVISIGKNAQETFVVNTSTTHEGDVTPGSTVDVRYYMDNGHRLATAIDVKTANKSTSKSGN